MLRTMKSYIQNNGIIIMYNLLDYVSLLVYCNNFSNSLSVQSTDIYTRHTCSAESLQVKKLNGRVVAEVSVKTTTV